MRKEMKEERLGRVFGLAKAPCPPKELPTTEQTEPKVKSDVYMDPFFGIRIVSPLVSSSFLKSSMEGRTPVTLFKLRSHTLHGDLSKDWTIGGVLVSKSATKLSQKGSKYVIWTLSDLKPGMKTVAVFLFGKSYEKLWKVDPGTVLGVINPSVLTQSSKSKDEATLSVNHPDQVMIWGRSKDLGRCKGKKRDGDQCSAFVNLTDCDCCSHHVQTEYRKFNKRAELQSSTCGTLRSLQNKVLGKSEVFYNGRSFTAVPAKPSKKMIEKDVKLLNTLGGPSPRCAVKTEPTTSCLKGRSAEVLNMLKPAASRKSKDEERLSQLEPSKTKYKPPSLSNPESDMIDLDSPLEQTPIKANPLKSTFLSLVNAKLKDTRDLALETKKPDKSKAKQSAADPGPDTSKPKIDDEAATLLNELKKETVKSTEKVTEAQAKVSKVKKAKPASPSTMEQLFNRSPATINTLGVPGTAGINLMVQTIARNSPKASYARLKAIELIKRKGGIDKNYSTGPSRKDRVAQKLNLETEETSKEENVLSPRFIELMNAKGQNEHLVEEFERKQMDLHYARLEKKEEMEEKMMTTFKLTCKAVRCLQCKYTWFSASDSCKAENHPLKVIDATKRFFKCNSCSSRTVALTKMPLVPCKSCGAISWTKTTMMKSKIVTSAHQLSIRGGEQKFINSVVSDANIDL